MENASYGKIRWFDRGEFDEHNPPWRFVIFLTEWTRFGNISFEEYAVHVKNGKKCHRRIKLFPKEAFEKNNFVRTLTECWQITKSIDPKEIIWVEKPSWFKDKKKQILENIIDWNLDTRESLDNILDSRVLYELRQNDEYY